MGAEVTDAEVIRRSRSEPRWFEVVFDRHFVPVHRYLHRRVGRELADALASETFVVAFDGRASFDLARPDARPWLYGIATNLLRRHWRSERRRLLAYIRSGVDPFVDPRSGEDLEAALFRADAEKAGPALALAVASLPEGDRDALLLFAWAELAYEDIALALGVPTGTVRSRLNRARRRLRELLEANGAMAG
jgi:RNA polymerase sigma factor (sigma-70 family)